jgi:hypothetical protein
MRSSRGPTPASSLPQKLLATMHCQLCESHRISSEVLTGKGNRRPICSGRHCALRSPKSGEHYYRAYGRSCDASGNVSCNRDSNCAQLTVEAKRSTRMTRLECGNSDVGPGRELSGYVDCVQDGWLRQQRPTLQHSRPACAADPSALHYIISNSNGRWWALSRKFGFCQNIGDLYCMVLSNALQYLAECTLHFGATYDCERYPEEVDLRLHGAARYRCLQLRCVNR